MPPQRPGRRVLHRAALPLALALLAGCAAPAKEESPPWYAGAAAAFYEDLGYWPEEVAGLDDGSRCIPDAELQIPGSFPDAESVDDLWQRVRAGYAMQGDVDERRIDRQLDLYADRQRFFNTINSQASWYLEYVVSEIEAREMPLELALLPIVESGYNPGATSRSQAAGIWQIIPGTARHLGLEQNGWYDGRRDVVASTEAALDYLSELHKRFDGDWYLALAAYNAGEGAVERAIERNRRLGRPTDYWSLPLSAQACNYVPRLLALSRVLEDPQQHGVEISPIPNRPALASVEVSEQIDLRRAASHAGLDSSELLSINAALRRGLTAPNTTTTLLVPAEDRDDLVAALQSMPAAAPVLAEGYRIRPGDTLGSIARLYRTTPEALRELNGMSNDRLVAGARLRLPAHAVEPPREFPTTASVDLKKRGIYTVQRGDNLSRIAQRVGVPVRQIATLNGLGKGAILQPGQTLRVSPEPAARSTAGRIPAADAGDDGRRRIAYTVRSGDSLARIANRFKVALPELMRWNGIDAARPLIKPGQSLVVYIDPSLAVAEAG